jgi:hypothetical protein
MESCGNQAPTKGDDGCGQELTEWYKMLRASAIATAGPPVPGPKPPSKKTPLVLADLPPDCKAVLNNGGGPQIAADGTVPAALARVDSKDAGTPAPRIDKSVAEALKAQMAATKGKKGAKDTPDLIASTAASAASGSGSGATATAAAASSAGAATATVQPAAMTAAPSDVPADADLPSAAPGADMPLPDRKPAR